jgi:hypothetical protein
MTFRSNLFLGQNSATTQFSAANISPLYLYKVCLVVSGTKHFFTYFECYTNHERNYVDLR